MLDITKKIKKVTLNGQNWEIDVSKKKIIVDNLPEAFSGFSFIYSFIIDEDNILVSSNIADCGLWLYSIKNNTYEQLYSSGTQWRYFIKLADNTILISSGSTNGFLVYNPLDKTINKYGSTITDTFGVLDNGKIVLYSTTWRSYAWLYNPQDKTAKQLKQASVFGKLSNGDYFLSQSGVSIYDANTDELIASRGNVRFQFYKELPNGNVFFGSDSHWSSGSFGVILYNATERTSTTLVTTTSTDAIWPIFLALSDNSCLCISSAGIGKFYNSSDGSVTDIFDWNTGISSGNYDQQILDLQNGKAIFSGFTSSGSPAGLFLFDYENATISKIYTSQNNYKLILLDNGNVFVYGTDYKNFGIHLYNTTDGTKTIIKENTSYTSPYSDAYKLPNGNVLVSGESGTSSQYGMYLYNYLDGTFTKVSPIRYGWDIYEPQENGDIIIKSSTSNKYTIKYLNDTGTVAFNTYYFGEV